MAPMEPGFSQPLLLSASICAKSAQLPEQLVVAIIHAESSGNAYAWKSEPAYRYLYDVARKRPFRLLTPAERASEVAPHDFPTLLGDRDTVWWGQQASWGPMQIMGAVARELGFVNHFPALCDTHFGVVFGTKHLANLRDRFLKEFGWAGVVAAYNAGSPRLADHGFVNQNYVDKVASFGGLKGL